MTRHPVEGYIERDKGPEERPLMAYTQPAHRVEFVALALVLVTGVKLGQKKNL